MNTKFLSVVSVGVFLIISASNYAFSKSRILLTMPPILAASVDRTPDPFSFTPINNAPVITYIISNTIVAENINISVPISITFPNCTYSINGNQFTSEYGSVSEGQRVRVKAYSPYEFGASRTCTLTIGEISSTFKVTTYLKPPPTNTCASGNQTTTWKEKIWQRCDDGNFYSNDEITAYCANLNLDGYYGKWHVPDNFYGDPDMTNLIYCDNGNPNLDGSGCGSGGYGPFSIPTIAPQFQATPDRYWYRYKVYYDSWVWHADFRTGELMLRAEDNPAKIRCIWYD